jgi:glutamate racemase
LTGPISYVLGERVTLVSSADETAKDLYRVLVAHNALAPVDSPRPTYQFMVTGEPAHFIEFGQRFLGPELATVETIALN